MLRLINRISILLVFVSAVFSFNINNPVNYSINLSDSLLEKGGSFTIDIDVKVDPGFLIYASNTLNLNPTCIEWADSSYFNKIELMTDSKKPKVKFDKYLEEDVFYHTDEVVFSQKYQLSDNIREDNILLEGEFVYQACDDKMCIPFFESFSKKITIINLEEFDRFSDSEKESTGIIAKFFIAFLGG